jgi:DNA (cytosine-5)-methyltransferase 1
LKRFVSVADALEPLESLGERAFHDGVYHQPNKQKILSKQPYDPRKTLVKSCITTSGGENFHYSGTRRFTARELSLFQTFPWNYHFTGTHGEATRQIGNAFPPVMAEALYRVVAQTLEAFDHGLISADDYISNLDALLEEKRVVQRSPYRYLVRKDSSSGTKHVASSSIFGRNTAIKPTSTPLPFRTWTWTSRERRRVKVDAELAEENGDLILLD